MNRTDATVSSISDNIIKEAEKHITRLCMGEVRNHSFTYKMLEWIPPYRVICQYVLDHYGIVAADIEFDESGHAHIRPLNRHPWVIMTEPTILDDDYPKPLIEPIDNSRPIDIKNIGDVKIVVKDVLVDGKRMN